MKKVLPNEIAASYECPACDWEHWFSSKQINHPKFIAICDCGEAFSPIPVGYRQHNQQPDETLSLSNKASIPKDNSSLDDNFEDAMSIVLSQGFDVRKLAKIEPKSGPVEDLIKYIVKSYV